MAKISLGHRIRNLGFNNYNEYLRSDHWNKIKRKYRMSRKRPQHCWCCGSKNNLQLHHKTYKRLGKEKLNDLLLICDECHSQLHNLVKRDNNMRLFTAASVMRSDNIRSGVYTEDTVLNKNNWHGVTTRFVKPESLRATDSASR
jgi:phage terminase large subunit GpA-like protein